MAEISAQMVKQLRERTGAGMMDCKKALVETAGDLEKAIDLLRQKGLAQAAKKAGRVAAEGLVAVYVAETGNVGAIAEVNCETDFVAKNSDFIEFTQTLVRQIAQTNPGSVAELLNAPYAEKAETVGATLTALVAKIGENISVRRFRRYAAENGLVHGYIHGPGRVGVLIQMAGKAEPRARELAHELSLQIAAMKARFARRDEVDPAELEREREIYRQKALSEGKPAAVVDRIVQGQIEKYYKDYVLTEQMYIRDDKKTVAVVIKEAGAALGAALAVDQFVRFEVGEGIERSEDDLSCEVAKLIQ